MARFRHILKMHRLSDRHDSPYDNDPAVFSQPTAWSKAIEETVKRTTESGIHTPDINGTTSTQEVGGKMTEDSVRYCRVSRKFNILE